jgi:heme-degrading monooxygenase HmoA
MPGELPHIVAVAVVQVLPGAAVTSDGGVDVVVSSLWESIPAWESWSKSAAGTQQHMPNGVYQYVPAKGEGFPEAFVPFRDYDTAVNAKY